MKRRSKAQGNTAAMRHRLSRAAERLRRPRRRRPVISGLFAGTVAVAAASALLLTTGSGRHTVQLSAGAPPVTEHQVTASTLVLEPATDPPATAPPATPATTSTTKPPPTTVGPPATTAAPTTTRPPTTVPATTSTTAAHVLTGRVLTAAGAPVPGAYLIGLHTLTVTRTNAVGDFSMACPTEPLAASPWLLPITTPGPHPQGVTTGQDTTSYPQQPSSEPVGYAFSGGATLAAATTPACDGRPLTFTLPPAATVTVTFSGPTSPAPEPAYFDNLYLPGLDPQAALQTAPLVSGDEQVISGLGAGTLRIDGATSTLTCTGPGVTADPSIAGATVAVGAGQSVDISCQT